MLQIQNGGRPPYWKSSFGYISTSDYTDYPINAKFCKWVFIAGKAKVGMAHSDCRWTCGCAGKTWDPLRTCAIRHRFCGDVSLGRGAITSVCTVLPLRTIDSSCRRLKPNVKQTLHCNTFFVQKKVKKVKVKVAHLI